MLISACGKAQPGLIEPEHRLGDCQNGAVHQHQKFVRLAVGVDGQIHIAAVFAFQSFVHRLRPVHPGIDLGYSGSHTLQGSFGRVFCAGLGSRLGDCLFHCRFLRSLEGSRQSSLHRANGDAVVSIQQHVPDGLHDLRLGAHAQRRKDHLHCVAEVDVLDMRKVCILLRLVQRHKGNVQGYIGRAHIVVLDIPLSRASQLLHRGNRLEGRGHVHDLDSLVGIVG